MTTCPDPDRLLDFIAAEAADPELQVHLQTCKECSMDMRVLREARGAFYPEWEMPEHLVRRVIERLPEIAESERVELERWDILGAGILGALTVTVAVLGTGSVGPRAFPVSLALLAAVGALAAVAAQRFAGNDEPSVAATRG
jgi:hypothetical protein